MEFIDEYLRPREKSEVEEELDLIGGVESGCWGREILDGDIDIGLHELVEGLANKQGTLGEKKKAEISM